MNTLAFNIKRRISLCRLALIVIVFFMSLSAAIFCLAGNVAAAELSAIVDSGKCGDSVEWKYYSNGELRLTGSGTTYDYDRKANWGCTTPWYDTYGNSITSITVDSGITDIGEAVFANLYYVNAVTLPTTLKSIGVDAFNGIDSLKTILIPASVEKIGAAAFQNCGALNSFIVSSENDNYCSDEAGVLYTSGYSVLLVFPEGKRVEEYSVNSHTEQISDYAFYNCQGCGRVTLPEGLHSIGEEAFYSADGLCEIYIPSTVTTIGERALSGCTSLERFQLSPDNKRFSVDHDGTLYDFEKTTLICYPSGLEKQQFIVPNGIKEIAPGAFINASILKVTLPDGLVRIGSYAFEYCMDLFSVSFPSTLEFIGHDAFFNCLDLQYVCFPASVKTIEYRAFHHCEGDAFFEGDAPTISISTPSLNKDITIHYRSGAKGWENSALADYTKVVFGEQDIAGICIEYVYQRGQIAGIQAVVMPFHDRVENEIAITLLLAGYQLNDQMGDIVMQQVLITPNELQTVPFSIPNYPFASGNIKLFAFLNNSFSPCCESITLAH